ncbi:MAG: PQQ-binding-like beta-propeller repeat protein [Planctomycetota bacterium]|nr:PQQ-binding-like beta-propeller repeat protein [Planctomycetota bacterium]
MRATSCVPLVLMLWVLASNCRAPEESPGPTAAAREEAYPLGPEMVQLEKDLATDAYHAEVLGWWNYRDLDGEMNRGDLRDSARRFARSHGGVRAVQEDPALRAAYERRLEIDRDFLALMKQAYRGLKKEDVFESELERLRREAESEAAGTATLPPAKPIVPILPAPGAGSQWPRWRGPGGQGISDEIDLPTEWNAESNVAWKTAIPGRGNSSPVIWDDAIFLTTAFDDGQRRSLVRVRRGDGELLWVRDAPAVPPERKVIDKNSWASPTPVVDGERVVVFLGNTGLVAFSLEGDVIWHYRMPWFDGSHGTGASPAISRDLVVLFQEHNRGKSIGVAVDKRTGEEKWKLELDPALGWCTALPMRVGERDELLLGLRNRVVGIDPTSGRELWSCHGLTDEVVPTLVSGHGLIYACSGRNGPTLAVRPGGDGDVTDTHVAWAVVRGAPHVPSAVLVDDLIYFSNDNGILTCLEATSGKTIYQTRLKGKFTASPVAADGKLYFTNERGETFVVRQGRDPEILAVNPLGETTLASIAVLDGRLHIRTEHHLWAIE